MNIDELEPSDFYKEISLLCIEKRRLWMKVDIREEKITAYEKELEAIKRDLQKDIKDFREEISRLQGLCRKHKIKFTEE